MNTSCFKNKYGTLTVASVSFCSAYSQKFNSVWISWPKNSTQICYTDLMCLLKLNHHDLTSKIHTVKSYKVTQAEDEIWTIDDLCDLVPRVYSAFKMAGRRRPGTHRYDTHADWSEDIDILTLVVIGRNCLPCKMAGVCHAVIFVISSAIETKLSPVKHSSCCFNYSR